MAMSVPFADLKAQYHSIKSEIDLAIQSVIESAAFVRGEYIEIFEQEYKTAHGVPHCISCGNGTDALYICLKALGIGIEDEVITTALSWISTSEVITQCGAKVVFVDIEPQYFTIDSGKIEEKITDKTKAIIPVHLYGQPADMDAIMAIARNHNLHVIEDCAQAHFAEYKGKKVGTFGTAGTFSFYPAKNLGAFGDAGAIISSDTDFSNRARMFANHGSLKKHEHEIEGINSRMDGLQAAILSVKLRYIHQWNEKRRQNALFYQQQLKDSDALRLPKVRPDVKHVFHQYVIRSSSRNQLQGYLNDHKIGTSIHYPKSLPFLKAYAHLRSSIEDFPLAFKIPQEILSLPISPEINQDSLFSVAKTLRSYESSKVLI